MEFSSATLPWPWSSSIVKICLYFYGRGLMVKGLPFSISFFILLSTFEKALRRIGTVFSLGLEALFLGIVPIIQTPWTSSSTDTGWPFAKGICLRISSQTRRKEDSVSSRPGCPKLSACDEGFEIATPIPVAWMKVISSQIYFQYWRLHWKLKLNHQLLP